MSANANQAEPAGGLPILVIGAGIAGLTAAAALGQKGFSVDIIERRPEISDGGGVGLSLVSNAMRALATIGVAEACVNSGIAADSIAMCNAQGEVMADNPLPRIGGPEWPGATGITRSGFHAILLGAAREVASIRCGTTVEAWTETPDAIAVRFSDGLERRYRLVVAADGIYSAMRVALMPESKPKPTGQAVWRAEVPRPEHVWRTHLFLGGAQGIVGLCPVSQDRAYLYIVQTAEPGTRREPETLHLQMIEELAGYGGVIAEQTRVLTDPAKVNYRPIEGLIAPRPWGRGRIVMIGDAVHTNPPVLAQGAAMGIEDAVVLAEEAARSPDDMSAALGRFIARRYDRVAFVVETSCQLAQWEVEHARDVDIPGVMKRSALRLAEAI